MLIIILVCILVPLLLLVYMYIESKMLITRRYRINADLPDTVRAVQLSDIHKKRYGNDWGRLIAKVKALSPDVIFITGDLVSRTERDYSFKGILIKRLREICPVYMCRGNHELDLPEEYMDKLRREIKENGGILLENESSVFCKGSTRINIYGANLRRSVYRNSRGGFSHLYRYTAEDLEKELGKHTDGINILLAHTPFFLDEYSEWGADIVLSGHVHGGIIGTPFGGLLSPERNFFPQYDKGMFKKNSTVMLLSAGIGKLRLFDPPEILLLDIDPAFSRKSIFTK